jgi:prophage antirepressor-like protein
VKSGTYQHMLKLDADQKQTIHRTPNRIGGLEKFIGKTASATAVSESGLYRLIMRADGAKAKPFRDWVAREVLPRNSVVD